MPSLTELLDDPSMSQWLRDALRSALQRDAIEAANDADLLRTILFRRAAETGSGEAGRCTDAP